MGLFGSLCTGELGHQLFETGFQRVAILEPEKLHQRQVGQTFGVGLGAGGGKGRGGFQELAVAQDRGHWHSVVDAVAGRPGVVQRDHLLGARVDHWRAGVAGQGITSVQDPIVGQGRGIGAAFLAGDALGLAHGVADDPERCIVIGRVPGQRQLAIGPPRFGPKHPQERVIQRFRRLDRDRVDQKAFAAFFDPFLQIARNKLHADDGCGPRAVIVEDARYAVMIGHQQVFVHQKGGAGKDARICRHIQPAHGPPHLGKD